ncbi:MAG: GNAT family N-acetyltransferase [Planctomycetes bacterium]|nr:GNAT family N-acetyltransferase [Planctomycetota bacterium]
MHKVRLLVFSEEQGIAEELDIDGLDDQCCHVIAKVDGEIIGTGRLTSDGHIGRMAVLKSYRGMGMGRKIMQTLISCAQNNKHSRLQLSSQCHAKGFYEFLGFQAFGSAFEEAGIDHIKMEKYL